MVRWRYNFRTRKVANKYIKKACKDTGGKCFVRRINDHVPMYRIFRTKREYENYKKKMKI